MKKVLLVAPLILALTACSSFKYNTGVELKGSASSGQRAFSNEVNYPDWYTKTPSKDAEGLYAVGSEYSRDFQFSVDKAMLSAKRELAANFSSYMSAMMKDFATESGMTGSDIARTDLERTTRMVIAKVNLVGVQRVNFKVVHENNGYRSFVQLRYSIDESNRFLMSEIRRNQELYVRFKASKSFRELDEEVGKIEKKNDEDFNRLIEREKTEKPAAEAIPVPVQPANFKQIRSRI
jgi:hypothetical protein